MYLIKWRNRNRNRYNTFSYVVVTGVSRYSSIEDAQKQIDQWKWYFPENEYYIEKE